MVSRGHHLLSAALPVLVPPITASLRRGGVIATIAFAEVTSGLGLTAEVGLDYLLAVGVLGGNV